MKRRCGELRGAYLAGLVLALFAGQNRLLLAYDVALASGQSVDSAFDARVARPAYAARHPKVIFDEGHNNRDTSGGLYKPFSDLITSDGYKVVPNHRTFSRATLLTGEVLVIVNASGPESQRSASAFTEGECNVVREWISSGGALLLITDHSPFASAASELAKVFGIDLTKGHTIDTVHYNKEGEDRTEIVFTREAGLIGDHAITRGRNTGERINRIITFSGTSLKGPPASVPFLKLSSTASDVLPPEGKPVAPGEQSPDFRTVSATGRAQGVALVFGKGRVVVLTEAAMLTAQVASREFHFGMSTPGTNNRQLALNIMHWLSGLLK